MIQRIIIILITGIILSSASCKKEQTEIYGIVKDFTGLDGCKILIVLDSGEKLEPVSLPPNTSLTPNKRVAIKYNTVARLSICMSGPTVEITSLRYL
jgi:hypothetical protein